MNVRGPTNGERVIKIILIVSGIFLTILIIAISLIEVTSLSITCQGCHEMRPEYYTWKASTHSQVNCLKCHVEPGIGNLFRFKGKMFNFAYLHFTKKYLLPISLKKDLPQRNCTRCHGSKRAITPAGDLIVPHDKHKSAGVQCLECHKGIAHGNILDRQETIDGDFSRWNLTYARSQMIPENVKTKMSLCMSCHEQRNVTRKCEACHRQIRPPKDHRASDWLTTHGKLARKNLKYCDLCHSYSNVGIEYNEKDPVRAYIKGNSFCYGCHSKRPVTHTVDWISSHGLLRTKNDISGCLTCHDWGQRSPIQTAGQSIIAGERQTLQVPGGQVLGEKKTYCIQCHRGQHNNFFAYQVQNHPVNLPPGTKLQGFCFGCHNVRQCQQCHKNAEALFKEFQEGRNKAGTSKKLLNPHQKYFQNGAQNHPVPLNAGTKRDSSCYRCHNQKYCTGCHKN
ncbi:cytochrome c3 family protein [Carboxydothermus ferrireducens]|uniref:Nitrate/TMAO reductase-like tetraheme cytochrome c subunit n=1 Tax=Carboxydothermus ferrireducens DSM 11255 TaxID=1119529 RepID=A0ABX2R8W8_9THEO|nr:NapC/NirT family cytochrome c [Carboxydothermus ferrireducens]NYE57369.1 nitrate/TMAO reductase-like tetraheme cytochrome c subunit [Carboxydothermus ferrireducens DSM 11255]